MATIKKFEDLEIWQLARQLCIDIFELTLKSEFSKDFSLKDQIRASSGSVMNNIAEGFGRGGNKEFRNFYPFQKDHVEKPGLSYTGHLTETTSRKKNWMIIKKKQPFWGEN
jgi:hypothetical protein